MSNHIVVNLFTCIRSILRENELASWQSWVVAADVHGQALRKCYFNVIYRRRFVGSGLPHQPCSYLLLWCKLASVVVRPIWARIRNSVTFESSCREHMSLKLRWNRVCGLPRLSLGLVRISFLCRCHVSNSLKVHCLAHSIIWSLVNVCRMLLIFIFDLCISRTNLNIIFKKWCFSPS